MDSTRRTTETFLERRLPGATPGPDLPERLWIVAQREREIHELHERGERARLALRVEDHRSPAPLTAAPADAEAGCITFEL